LATLRAAFSWGDVLSARASAVRSVELVPYDLPLRSAATWSLAISDYFSGDLDAADRWFEESVEAGLRDERWLVTASALAYRSLIAGEHAWLDEQRRLAQDAADIARERGLEEILGEVHVAVGVTLEAEGELEAALPHLERGAAVLRAGQPLDRALALLHHARVLQATGRREAAAAAIAAAAATIELCPDPGILRRRLDARKRAPLAPWRDPDLSGRELVVLRMLNGTLSERDIGRELYLSHNTIHSHTKSIYRKLGVSSRRQAVQRAVTLGLL
jgi:LuxR family maltose regulon positive regulatory protein